MPLFTTDHSGSLFSIVRAVYGFFFDLLCQLTGFMWVYWLLLFYFGNYVGNLCIRDERWWIYIVFHPFRSDNRLSADAWRCAETWTLVMNTFLKLPFTLQNKQFRCPWLFNAGRLRSIVCAITEGLRHVEKIHPRASLSTDFSRLYFHQYPYSNCVRNLLALINIHYNNWYLYYVQLKRKIRNLHCTVVITHVGSCWPPNHIITNCVRRRTFDFNAGVGETPFVGFHVLTNTSFSLTNWWQ